MLIAVNLSQSIIFSFCLKRCYQCILSVLPSVDACFFLLQSTVVDAWKILIHSVSGIADLTCYPRVFSVLSKDSFIYSQNSVPKVYRQVYTLSDLYLMISFLLIATEFEMYLHCCTFVDQKPIARINVYMLQRFLNYAILTTVLHIRLQFVYYKKKFPTLEGCIIQNVK